MTTKKTDREDALKLAKTVRDRPLEDLPVVTAPDEKTKQQRKILSEYNKLVEDRTHWINRLHGVFEHCVSFAAQNSLARQRRAAITDMKRKDLKTKKIRAKNIEMLEGYEKEEALRLCEIIDLLEKQIAILKEKIKKESEETRAIQIAEQVPGVGELTAMAFVAAVGDVNRFSGMEKIGGFLGFTPKIDCSGDTVRYGKITKRGNNFVRGLLVQAAWSLVRSRKGGALKEKYEHMVLHGKSKKKAIVAVARKLAELMYTLIKNDGVYEARKFKMPQPPSERLSDLALAG